MTQYSISTRKSPDSKFNVTYTYVKAPLDAQKEFFKSKNLTTISPAQKALMSMDNSEDNTFLKYSRTNMGILFIPLDDKIALIQNAFSDDKSIQKLLYAHKLGEEAILEYETAHIILEKNLKNHTGIVLSNKPQTIATTNFSDDITQFMFTDESINLKAEDYGYYLKNEYNISKIQFDFEDSTSIDMTKRSKKSIYFDKIRIRGLDGNFTVYGRGKPLTGNGGGIGVRFESTESNLSQSKDL